MADLTSIQDRGQQLFRRLLEAESRGNRVVSNVTHRAFNWFNLEDAQEAAAFAFRLSALVRSTDNEIDGLSKVIDSAEHEAVVGDTAMVRQALSMFVTHNNAGRKLIKPRTVLGAPGLFVRSPQRRPGGRFHISEGGASPQLDYWREDVLANEHHEHWHQVYPFTGLPVRDFDEWVTNTSLDQMVEILNALQPDPTWRSRLENAPPEAIATFFAQLMAQGAHTQLPNELRALFNAPNDRHGELFVYMHTQMLARYDAELLSHNLDRVAPFDPVSWSSPVDSGHNPIDLPFDRRRPGQRIQASFQDLLTELQGPIENALDTGQVIQGDGTSIDLNPILVGEMIEAAAPWTTTLDTNLYQGLHNTGHGILARLATPDGNGVMNSPVVAIRDPIFWRWHKHIDNLAASWQEEQTPYPFDDQPDVLMRNGIPHESAVGVTPPPWQSPDIVLVNTDLLPAGVDPVQVGESLLGGGNWDIQPSDVTGSGADAITDELTTMMVNRVTPTGPAPFLSHTPFSYYLRIENPAASEIDITVRIFLAPTALVNDRRAWIEMDKFHTKLPPSQRTVLYRADTESAVIKRPAERSPDDITPPGSSAGEAGYCDCGWPWTLLLPRGTPDGMDYRLIAMCTDWQIDRVSEPEHCGSMSFCGAVDRYPDQRDMGYPFCRPFAEPIDTVFASLQGAGGRSLTIRHLTN